MGIGVLGPLTVEGSSAAINRRDRVVLSALAARSGHVLTTDELAQAVWGDCPPASWSKNLQGCVMRLRKLLGATAIETLPEGYRLTVAREQLDAGRFERLVDRARELLLLGEGDRAGFLLDDALGLWRGDALRELSDWDTGRIEAARLNELRLDAEELRLEAALRSGEHARVLTDLMAMVRAQPLRERRWGLLAQAQYQSGRQAEALRTLREVRTLLARELGLDPGPDLLALEQAILAQDPALVRPPLRDASSSTCPYPGLLAYQVDDAETFFGRDRDVAACLQRLHEVGVLAVVGASGCGKSSLVRAGVLAALCRDGARVSVMTPGTHPLDLIAEARRLRPGTSLFVDQCEEAFTHLGAVEEQVEFLDGLLEHSRRAPLVLSLRVDKMAALSVHPNFARLAERGLYLLGGMGVEELRSAIEGPARQAGLLLEPGLVDLLVRDLEGEPGALPMMSHALRACWERREGRTLTVSGYAATGGIREAVARTAEAVYEQVGVEERVLVRDLMLRLVVPGREGEPVRSRLAYRLVTADADHQQLVEMLIRARLLTSDDGTLELAHESLARAWPRLRGWLDDDTEGHRILRHLSAAADAWKAMAEPDSELYRGARLTAALEWRDRTTSDLTPAEQEFLSASASREAQEHRSAELRVRRERRVNRRLRGLVGALVVVLLVATLAGWGALRQAQRADRASLQSDSRLAGARGLLTEQPDLAALLALAGVRLDDSPTTRANLLATLTRAPQLIGAARGRGGPFWGLEASPDGSTLAGYDDRNEVWLYDATTRQVRTSFDADGGKPQLTFWPGMSPLAFSPDGRLMAVGKTNLDPDSVVLLNTRSFRPVDRQLGELPAQPSMVNDVEFSADGSRVAAAFIHHERGSNDWVGSSVLVWDTTNLTRPVNTIRLDGPAGLTNIAFGRDRDQLWVYRDRRGPLLTWYGLGPDGRASAHHTPTPSRQWSPFRMRPDHRQMALFDGSVALLRDMVTGKVRRLVGHEGPIDNLAYSPDGRYLATGSDDRTAIVWDALTGELRERFQTNSPGTYGVRFSADGRTLYTAGLDRQLQAWDVSGKARFIPLVQRLPKTDLGDKWSQATARGDHIAYTWFDGDAGPSHLRFLDVAAGRVTRVIDSGHREYGASDWSPDGRRFATTGADGAVRLWSPTGRMVRERVVAPGHLSGLQYQPDGGTIVVSERKGIIRWLDATTLAPVRKPMDVGESVLMIAVGPGGRRVFAVMNAPVLPPPVETYPPPDRWAIADAKTGEVRHGGLGLSLATAADFSPGGTRIAVGDSEGAVALLDATTGRPVRPVVPGHDAVVDSLYSGADDDNFVTGADDGSVSLWSGRAGELLGTVASQHDAPASAQLLRDGRTVMISDVRGRVYAWDIRPDRWHAFGCGLAGRDLTAQEWRATFGPREQTRICRSR